nr:aspartyl beta-hydroxylase [Halioglobus sp.]
MTDQIEQAAQPLIGAALATLQRGDARAALGMLLDAERKLPASLGIKLNLALAYRTLADYPGALRALNAALALDPYFFLALLSKGMVLEQMGRPRIAAEAYRNALKIAPPPDQTPPSLDAPIKRARACVAEQAAALASYLRHQLGALRTQHSGESLGRFEECLDVLAGTKQVFHAEPVLLHVPRLPAIPFFEREYFPWLGQLEAATETIGTELLALLEAGMPGVEPYIQYPPGTPETHFAP